MIIFYNRLNGEIAGYISGEKHYKEEANFWVGDKAINDRVIYAESALHYKEIIKDPLFFSKFKVDLETLFLKPIQPS